tara:strand:- start:82158 stop:82676 length:519 start_codon:yes stop_codon:yes gene_type:complete
MNVITPTKAFFEFNQIENTVEVTTVLSNKDYDKLFSLKRYQLISGSSDEQIQLWATYVRKNIKIVDSRGNKQELISVKKLGEDSDKQTKAFKFIYNRSNCAVQRVQNTFLFDFNVHHVNFNVWGENDQAPLLTDVDNTNFIVTYPAYRMNYLLISAIIIGVVFYAAYLVDRV